MPGSTRRFTTALAVLLAVLVGLQVVGGLALKTSHEVTARRVHLATGLQELRYYDELMTMSAKLNASELEPSYEARHVQTVPQMTRTQRLVLADVPDRMAREQVARSEAARQVLTAMEIRSFELTRHGEAPAALALLGDREYREQKQTFTEGLAVAYARLETILQREADRSGLLQLVTLLLGLVSAVLLPLLWARTSIGLRRATEARARVEAQLRQQASADPLTGLANRRLFRENLSEHLEHRVGAAVLFCDLDNFKVVNDTHGHAQGDDLLVEVAHRLGELVNRVPGALGARLGGDEFAVLLPLGPALSPTDVHDFADELVRALAEPYDSSGQHRVSASVGLAIGEAGADEGEVMRSADLAMYSAKASGRGRWCRYQPGMHRDLLDRVEVERDLREGIPRGEIVLHYQAVYDLRTHRPYSVEALARWVHPRRGLLVPVHFIRIAEETGLIVDLGRSVLEQACAQLARWRVELGAQAPAEVAVNVSAAQLEHPGFVAEVAQVLSSAGLAPTSLKLEITESMAMGAAAPVIATLERLRAHGVRIAIDDFGTGHSSLARLRDLPVDEVKLDRAFVREAAPVTRGEVGESTMVEVAVTLAARLGLDLVAEGVETVAQLRTLQRLGCPRAQGYLLHRPEPAHQTTATLTREDSGIGVAAS